MSTGKIELSVGAVKIADKYEILTEEEIHNIDDKIPELDKRVGVIEDEIEEINSSLDNKASKTITDDIQQQVNNLVLGAVGDGNNAEIVQARGRYDVLNDRLNIIDNSLFSYEDIENNNCIGFNDCSIDLNGVTLIIKDGVFELNGTATANTELNILTCQKSPMLENKEYTFKCKKISGSSNAPNEEIRFYYTSNAVLIIASGGVSKTMTLSEEQSRAKIYVSRGTSYQNFKFNFWCEEGKACGDYIEYGLTTLVEEKHKEDFDNMESHISNDEMHINKGIKDAINDLIATSSIFDAEINDTVDKIYNNMNGQCLSFAWLSDTHTYPNYDAEDSSTKQYIDQIRNIKAVNEKIGFDMLIHGGDIINTQWLWKNPTISSEEYQRYIHDHVMKLKNSGIDNIYICMGNHDGGFIPNTDGGVGTEYSSHGCFYKNTKQSQTDNKGKVSRIDTKPYFYVDYPNLKLRCIFLATNMHSETSDWKGIDYQQALWIKNTLDNIDKDYNILLFTHIPLTRFYNHIGSAGSTLSAISLLNGFNNHAKVDDGGESLDSDYTEKEGKILACFSGHYHGDSIILPNHEKAIFGFPEITIASGGYLGKSVITTGDFYDELEAPSREYGCITQDVWDGVVYSIADNKIYLTRFGAGEDRVIDLN